MGNSISSAASCISFDSYIKPQLGKGKGKLSAVVYLLIPTSNHNTMSCLINTIVLYIFWFLHQTTTVELFNCRPERCISFDSYIKPQRATRPLYSRFCCISFDSYIKPQRARLEAAGLKLYIFWFLHQTTTRCLVLIIRHLLYIFWFLHQTTTAGSLVTFVPSLYIFWFLHQTTTQAYTSPLSAGCISFDSYIKPQPLQDRERSFVVVYLLIPTSNHNSLHEYKCSHTVVYLLIPTSNHNYLVIRFFVVEVVYLLIPTSNHNVIGRFPITSQLYIFWFLHQTTTVAA